MCTIKLLCANYLLVYCVIFKKTKMNGIQTITSDILCIVPKYDGDEKLLNLFITKCEYVLSGSRIPGNLPQELYLFHALSSKLTGRAASLLSDNPNITTWEQLKDVLTQHFGDPRSEECIAIELESLKLKQGESYIQFCQTIQNVKSALFAKVNRLSDEGVKAAKMIIYNNTALNVFLYNLPEDLIRIVRLKGCSDLENALSIVTEEVNFQTQYNAKNKLVKQQPSSQNTLKPFLAPQGFRPAFNMMPQNNTFKFGIPPNNSYRFGVPQNQGFRQPNRFVSPQGQFGPPQNQPQRNFGQAPFQQPRAPFQHGGFRFGIPHQQGYRLGSQNQSQMNPNQFKFGIPNQQVQANRFQNSDVSMRTAPIRQNMTTNDLYYIEDPNCYLEYPLETYYDNDDNNTYEMYSENVAPPLPNDFYYEENPNDTELASQDQNNENFQKTASNRTVK